MSEMFDETLLFPPSFVIPANDYMDVGGRLCREHKVEAGIYN